VSSKARPRRAEPIPAREQELQNALACADRSFGPGVVVHPATPAAAAIRVIPTGSLALDLALGVGGVPRGRLTEIYGPDGAGKTTLALSVLAQAQRFGGLAAVVDAEHALDLSWAQRVGVDLGRLVWCRPACGEQALEVADLLLRSGSLDALVVDSIPALVPSSELDGEMGDCHAGRQASLLSQAMRKLAGPIAHSGTAVVVTNQLREKVGTLFGIPEQTTGGRALRYFASIRLDLRRVETLKDDQRVVGARLRAKVVKNKVAAPYGQAEFDLLFDRGVCWEASLLDIGVEAGLISRSGAWFAFGEVRLGQGRQQACQALAERAELAGELEAKLCAHLGLALPVRLPAQASA